MLSEQERRLPFVLKAFAEFEKIRDTVAQTALAEIVVKATLRG